VSGAILTPEIGSKFRFEESGTYYLRLELADDTEGQAAGQELPVELLVDIVGEPVAPSSTSSPDADDDDESDGSGSSGSASGPPLQPQEDDDALLLVAGSGLSLVAGAALGALLTRRFRRGARV